MKKVLLILFGAFCYVIALAQWSDNPNENNQITPVYSLYDTEMKTNKNGVTYLVFNRPNGGEGYYQTFLQIIDRTGVKLFPEEGKLISSEPTLTWTAVNELLYIDNDGNALIAVCDLRNSNPGTQDLSYTIYKVSPTGEHLWGENGLDLQQGNVTDFQAQIKMIQLEDGSYIFTWIVVDYNTEAEDIFMQRVSKEGGILWDDELKISGASYPYLVKSGNNQFILVYAKGSNSYITARKMDFDGENVWANEVTIYQGGFTIPPLQVILEIVSDQRGGVFVGWYDDRFATRQESVYVSYVKSDGTLGFVTAGDIEGLRVGYAPFRGFRPRIAVDSEKDCIFVLWEEGSESQSYIRYVMQKISYSGELFWDPDGVMVVDNVFPSTLGYHSIQSAGDGRVAVFYMIAYSTYHSVGNYVALFDSDGEYIWENETVEFALPGHNKEGLLTSSLINDSYWVTMWEDFRDSENLYNSALYMQRINIDGTLGDNGTSIKSLKTQNDIIIIPSVVETTTEIIFDNPKTGNVDISLYSITGQKVTTIHNGQLMQGTNSINWNKNSSISSGIYLVVVTTTEGTKSSRIIIK